MIRRAEHVYGRHEGIPLAFSVEHHQAAKARAVGQAVEPRPTPDTLASYAIRAHVNYGRWIAECPNCASAQVVSPEDPRFWCVECGNEYIGGAWAELSFPTDLDGIERLLMQRPFTRNRNWLPDESVDDLIAENEAHREESELVAAAVELRPGNKLPRRTT